MKNTKHGEKPKRQHKEIKQLQIVHLSDLHFGSSHNFNPDLDPNGKPLSQDGVKKFDDILLDDVDHLSTDYATMFALTGDFTTKHEEAGFERAGLFMNRLAKSKLVEGGALLKNVFVVPGNHDIDFEKTDQVEKWYRFKKFYNGVFKESTADSPLDFVKLVNRADLGYCVLTLNSEMYVSKDADDKYRGRLGDEQLEIVADLLAKNKSDLKKSICVALIHHHPVLIPDLVEANRNYDAVIGAGRLLTQLNKYGFHTILHGHKHWPCTFSVDNRNGYDTAYSRPMLVVSGGSVGSSELPKHSDDRNVYNRIRIKWNSDSDEIRICIETRALNRLDENRQPLPTRSKWHWSTIRTDDRIFYRHDRVPPLQEVNYHPQNNLSVPRDAGRKKQYERMRLNMPVVEVRPSLESDQKYEAVFWLVGHSSIDGKDYRNPKDIPKRVTWSAGNNFQEITILR
ncbi:MAG: metallophosphoesterase [Verrucomicrobiota bacterium]